MVNPFWEESRWMVDGIGYFPPRRIIVFAPGESLDASAALEIVANGLLFAPELLSFPEGETYKVFPSAIAAEENKRNPIMRNALADVIA
jgi:hypothetical protein